MKKIIRATPANGYEKLQLGDELYLTNTHVQYLAPGDFVQMDLTDQRRPVYTLKLTKDKGNNSRARCFPMRVEGTAFLKLYDSPGYNIHPRTIDKTNDKKRIVGLESAPWFDYSGITERIGYPCLVKDMPESVVYADAYIPNSMMCNTLCDSYAVIKEYDNDHVEQWQKKFNVQIQMDHGATNVEGNHAWGMSGATPVGREKINGVTFIYGHKLETAGHGNRFKFASLCAIDSRGRYIRIPEVCVSDVWQFFLNNWGRVQQEARKAGVSYDDISEADLWSATMDGLHVGNEGLGYAVGAIRYQKLDIVVNKDSVPVPEPVPEPVPKADTPTVVTDEEDTRHNSEPAPTGSEPQHTKSRRLKVGQRRHLPGSRSGGKVEHMGDPKNGDDPGCVSVIDTHYFVTVRAMRRGVTHLRWTGSAGAQWITKVTVR